MAEMDCKDVKEKMLDFLDGTGMDRSTAEAMERHIESCAGCREEKNAYESTWDMLGLWKDREPDPLFRAKFWEKASKSRGIFFLVRRYGLSMMALALTLVLLFMPHDTAGDGDDRKWNSGAMENLSLFIEYHYESPHMAGLGRDTVIMLPDYVETAEEAYYPELDIGRNSVSIMDGAHEALCGITGAASE